MKLFCEKVPTESKGLFENILKKKENLLINIKSSISFISTINNGSEIFANSKYIIFSEENFPHLKGLFNEKFFSEAALFPSYLTYYYIANTNKEGFSEQNSYLLEKTVYQENIKGNKKKTKFETFIEKQNYDLDLYDHFICYKDNEVLIIYDLETQLTFKRRICEKEKFFFCETKTKLENQLILLNQAEDKQMLIALKLENSKISYEKTWKIELPLKLKLKKTKAKILIMDENYLYKKRTQLFFMLLQIKKKEKEHFFLILYDKILGKTLNVLKINEKVLNRNDLQTFKIKKLYGCLFIILPDETFCLRRSESKIMTVQKLKENFLDRAKNDIKKKIKKLFCIELLHNMIYYKNFRNYSLTSQLLIKEILLIKMNEKEISFILSVILSRVINDFPYMFFYILKYFLITQKYDGNSSNDHSLQENSFGGKPQICMNENKLRDLNENKISIFERIWRVLNVYDVRREENKTTCEINKVSSKINNFIMKEFEEFHFFLKYFNDYDYVYFYLAFQTNRYTFIKNMIFFKEKVLCLNVLDRLIEFLDIKLQKLGRI